MEGKWKQTNKNLFNQNIPVSAEAVPSFSSFFDVAFFYIQFNEIDDDEKYENGNA